MVICLVMLILHFGFGFDVATDDHKLVRISHSNNQVYVYNLKANSWKRVQDLPYHDSFTARLDGGGTLVGVL